MNRRSFFSSLAGAAVVAADFDPERALWVPGRKRIFIPPPEPSPTWLALAVMDDYWESYRNAVALALMSHLETKTIFEKLIPTAYERRLLGELES